MRRDTGKLDKSTSLWPITDSFAQPAHYNCVDVNELPVVVAIVVAASVVVVFVIETGIWWGSYVGFWYQHTSSSYSSILSIFPCLSLSEPLRSLYHAWVSLVLSAQVDGKESKLVNDETKTLIIMASFSLESQLKVEVWLENTFFSLSIVQIKAMAHLLAGWLNPTLINQSGNNR